MRFEGIYTPVITPHRPNCEIDRDNFAVVIEHLIESGMHAFDQYTQLKTLWIDTADREMESGIA